MTLQQAAAFCLLKQEFAHFLSTLIIILIFLFTSREEFWPVNRGFDSFFGFLIGAQTYFTHQYVLYTILYTFAETAPFQVPKSGTSDAETKKRRPLIQINIPAKWWITCLFYAFTTFGWVLSQFLKIVFLDRFGAVFKAIWPKNFKLLVGGVKCVIMSKQIFFLVSHIKLQ